VAEVDILAARAVRHPDQAALIDGDQVGSWAALVECWNRLDHARLA
jgi:hypothetical protein